MFPLLDQLHRFLLTAFEKRSPGKLTSFKIYVIDDVQPGTLELCFSKSQLVTKKGRSQKAQHL